LSESSLAKPKAILFDLDGTLLDTSPDLGAALNYVLSIYQLPNLSEQHYRPYSSDGTYPITRVCVIGKFPFGAFYVLLRLCSH
jgi:phosphoglycolate phosphatase-like HAD superfamily hydrolase